MSPLSSNLLFHVPRRMDISKVDYVDPAPEYPILPAYHLPTWMVPSPGRRNAPMLADLQQTKRNDGVHTPERCVPFKIRRGIDIRTAWVLCEFSRHDENLSRFSIWDGMFLVPVTSINLVISLYGDPVPWDERIKAVLNET